MKRSVILVSIMLCVLFGCNMGGGGSVHQPPANASASSDIEFIITYSVTGWGSGDRISRHYNQVLLTVNGTDKYEMKLQKEMVGMGNWSVVVPKNTYKSGQRLTYDISCRFDGVFNSRSEKITLSE